MGINKVQKQLLSDTSLLDSYCKVTVQNKFTVHLLHLSTKFATVLILLMKIIHQWRFEIIKWIILKTEEMYTFHKWGRKKSQEKKQKD